MTTSSLHTLNLCYLSITSLTFSPKKNRLTAFQPRLVIFLFRLNWMYLFLFNFSCPQGIQESLVSDSDTYRLKVIFCSFPNFHTRSSSRLLWYSILSPAVAKSGCLKEMSIGLSYMLKSGYSSYFHPLLCKVFSYDDKGFMFFNTLRWLLF